MVKRKYAIRFFLLVYLICSALLSLVSAETIRSNYLYIGVLAKDGKDVCFEQWDETALYLREKLPEVRTQILCLDFKEIEQAVEAKRVDFTITNPSIYVNIEHKYGASRLATLRNRRGSRSYTKFGGVIFYRSDREDIKTIDDFKNKSLMAVAQNSFGGWYISQLYFQNNNIDPFKFFRSISFGGNHDSVVFSVLNGDVDVGCVRTDTLERMGWESKIDLSEITILDPQDVNESFDFIRTTSLYPEWPLAKLKHTSADIAKLLAIAMMQMPADSKAARFSRSMGWTIPLDYHDVHKCLRALKAPPYEEIGKISLVDLYHQYQKYIYILAVFTLLTLCGVAITLVINRRLAVALEKLDDEHRERAQVVADLNEFKLTLEQTLDCVFMFSPDTLRFFYVNQGALDQVGYSREEILAMTPTDIKPEFNEEQFRTMVAPLIGDSDDSLTFTTTHKHKDGTLIPVEVFLRFIKPPEKAGRFVAVVRDITLKKQQEEEKKLLQTKLLHEQKLASVGQLAAGVAHEINTPAQYLGSNINFLQEAFSDINNFVEKILDLPAQRDGIVDKKDMLKRIQDLLDEIDWEYLKEEIPVAIDQSSDGVEQVSSIVLAMKNFAHPGGVDKEMANLNELLNTTITVARNEWKYIVELEMNLEDNLPPVPCVRNEITQVFLNLLVNGAHAVEEKIGVSNQGEKGVITIKTWADTESVFVSFADTGCGIRTEDKDKIFDPFFTTKEVGKGSGQGLTIAYDIITNKHQGTFEVLSKLGEGSEFIVSLPQKEDVLEEGEGEN